MSQVEITPEGNNEILLPFFEVNPRSTKKLVWKTFSDSPVDFWCPNSKHQKSRSAITNPSMTAKAELAEKYPNLVLIKKLKTKIKGENYKILLLGNLKNKERLVEVRNSVGTVVASVARPKDCNFEWNTFLVYRGLLIIISTLTSDWMHGYNSCFNLADMISVFECHMLEIKILRGIGFYYLTPVAVDHSTNPETILMIFVSGGVVYLGRFGHLNLVISSSDREVILSKPIDNGVFKSGPELLFSTTLLFSHFIIGSILVDGNGFIWINIKKHLGVYGEEEEGSENIISVFSPDFSLLFEGEGFAFNSGSAVRDVDLDVVEGQVVASLDYPKSRCLLLSLE
jgi:hypothetical protein